MYTNPRRNAEWKIIKYNGEYALAFDGTIVSWHESEEGAADAVSEYQMRWAKEPANDSYLRDYDVKITKHGVE